MLTEIGLKDFKSFAALPDGSEQRVGVAPLTLLVGANASGKSNFLDALQFLQGLALDLSVAEVLSGRYDGQREVWPGLRGGAAEVAHKSRGAFALSTAWAVAKGLVSHALTCIPGGAGSPHITQEEAVLPGGRLGFLMSGVQAASAKDITGHLHIPLEEGEPSQLARSVQCTTSALGAVIADLSWPDAVTNECRIEALRALQSSLRGASLFDIRAARMRQYVPTSAPVLGVNGENASAVLWRLCQDPARKQEIVDWIAELCADEITDIRFDETRLKEVMLLLVEKDGSEISARSASDGTLRFVGLLLALLTAERGSTLLLEEVENGLHPARIHLLVELLERVTRENGVQVIATTHSPVVLAALSRETLGNVIAFGRHPDVPGTLMKRLADLPNFGEVLERRGIEYLFTSQWLERAL